MKISGLIACALPLAIAVPAMAQDVPAAAEAASAPAEEADIIVTATRRSEALQRVPAAISAITETRLQEAGIEEARDLPQLAPSLFISTTTSESAGAQVRLRGVGTSSQNVGFEGSVGIFEDGVYLNRPGEALTDLMDVKRVEVLRGPQGTLYGKNTTTGIINIITNEPTFDWSGEAAASYGNLDAVRLSGALSGPLIDDKVAFRIAGLYNRRDGYIHNVLDGRVLNDRNRYQLRAQLLLKPFEGTTIRIIGSYQQKDEHCCAAPYTQLGSGSSIIAALGGTVLDPTQEINQYRVALTGPMSAKVRASGITVIGEQDLGWGSARMIYGHRLFKSNDANGSTPLDILNVYNQRLRDRLDTLELQLNADVGPADLVLGVFAYDNAIQAQQSSVFGADAGRFYNRLTSGAAAASLYPAGAGDTLQSFDQDGKGLSVFTHNVIEIATGLKATLGLRWLTEKKTGAGVLYTDGVAGAYGGPLPARCLPSVPSAGRVLCPANPNNGTFSDSHWIYALGLSYEPMAGVLLYANLTTGYKAGGINAAKDARGATTVNPALVNGTFASETVTSYEVGFKSRTADRLLTLNATAFLMDFKNFQYQTRDNTTFSVQVQTAAGVRSKGIEVEATVNPAPGLEFGGNASYILAHFTPDTLDPTTRGKRLGNAPIWTLQPFVNYGFDLNDRFRLSANVNARYISNYNANVTLLPGAYQPGTTIVNASLKLEHGSGASVSLFAQNLFDKYYPVLRAQAPLQTATYIGYLNEPRTYGVTVRKTF